MRLFRHARLLAPILFLVGSTACVRAQSGSPTVITGTVYSPKGAASGDPIPNILVFVAGGPVSPFTSAPTGPGVTGGCLGQEQLVSGNPIVSAVTDYQGNFTLSNPALTALGTTTVNLVIQAGKWRRQYPNTSIVGGQVNALPGLAMPGQKGTLSDGTVADLPHIAVVTGKVDGLECIFPQIGISTSEVTNPDGTGSINLYAGSASPGAVVTASTSADPTPPETTLVTDPALMNTYDVIMFACQGTPTQPVETTAANQTNVFNYANLGGRVFTTHWQYLWIDSTYTFPSVADWLPPPPLGTTANSPATINTSSSFSEGVLLADWMHYIGADTGTYGQIALKNTAVNTSMVNVPPSQSWVTLNNTSGNPSMQFTFNTPIGQNGVPTVGISYTNNTQTFLPGDTGDSITITATNTSTTDADATLTMTLTLPQSITATNLVDSSGGTWTCNLALAICTRTSALTAGSSDSVTLTFNISPTAVIGQASLTTALSGGNLSSTGQCGRVLYNDYHVESQGVAKNTIFPAECSTGALTPQEKFLEFTLYNLSNFISPSATDLFDIQGVPQISWANPLTSIYFGTTPYTSTQFPTASYNGTPVSGVFTYVPALTTILPVGLDSVCVTFAPTNTTDYVSVRTPFCTTIQVLPDTTTTAIASIASPIFYGQTFTLLTPTVISGGPTSLNEGTVAYTVTNSANVTTPVCSITLPNGGSCNSGIYDAGNYTFQACYTDAAGNFAPSCSTPYPVVINPDPTTAAVTSNNDPAAVGTSVTLTATIGDVYATALGSVTFFDGTLNLGTSPLTGTTASVSVSSFIVGAHSITACYAPSIDPSGTYDFLPICSAPFIEQVTIVPSPAVGTVTLLNSSANPSVVGQAVTFSAVVATTGPFPSIPTGSLNFYDQTTLLNPTPIALDASGDAALTTSTLTVGTHPITAVFAGNNNYAPSNSQPLQQLVLSSVPSAGNGFLMLVNPTVVSVGVGNAATVTVQIADLNNFNQTVQLTCSGLPGEATCTFARSLIPVGGGTTTLTITPAAPHTCGSSTPDFIATNSTGATWPLFLLSTVGMLLIRRRKRLMGGVLLGVGVCLLMSGLSGCSSTCKDFGTQPGTYTFTVTATAAGATPQVSTQTVQMVVHL
jgi:protein involved in ribonucleotide reduction